MKLNELIEKFQEMEKLYGNVEVKVDEIKEGDNASDRYGVGIGLIVGDIEIKDLQKYVSTGCYY